MSTRLSPDRPAAYRGEPEPQRRAFDVVVTARDSSKVVFHGVSTADYLDNGYIKIHLVSGKVHVFRVPEVGSVLAVDKYEEDKK